MHAGRVPFEKRVGKAPPAPLSEGARALVRRLLAYEPTARPSMPQLLLEPWLAADAINGRAADDDAREGHRAVVGGADADALVEQLAALAV